MSFSVQERRARRIGWGSGPTKRREKRRNIETMERGGIKKAWFSIQTLLFRRPVFFSWLLVGAVLRSRIEKTFVFLSDRCGLEFSVCCNLFCAFFLWSETSWAGWGRNGCRAWRQRQHAVSPPQSTAAATTTPNATHDSNKRQQPTPRYATADFSSTFLCTLHAPVSPWKLGLDLDPAVAERKRPRGPHLHASTQQNVLHGAPFLESRGHICFANSWTQETREL